jgi:hypothetical protein
MLRAQVYWHRFGGLETEEESFGAIRCDDVVVEERHSSLVFLGASVYAHRSQNPADRTQLDEKNPWLQSVFCIELRMEKGGSNLRGTNMTEIFVQKLLDFSFTITVTAHGNPHQKGIIRLHHLSLPHAKTREANKATSPLAEIRRPSSQGVIAETFG